MPPLSCLEVEPLPLNLRGQGTTIALIPVHCTENIQFTAHGLDGFEEDKTKGKLGAEWCIHSIIRNIKCGRVESNWKQLFAEGQKSCLNTNLENMLIQKSESFLLLFL